MSAVETRDLQGWAATTFSVVWAALTLGTDFGAAGIGGFHSSDTGTAAATGKRSWSSTTL